MKALHQKTKYNLMMCEREFKKKTLTSFYFRSKETPTKKFAPIDLIKYDAAGNAYRDRKRQNLITGEIANYDLLSCQLSQRASLRRTKILLNEILDANDFMWFCTLTFDKSKVDRNDDNVVLKRYKKFVHDLRRDYSFAQFITVPERHEKHYDEEQGARHFHMLIGGVTPTQLGLVDSGTVLCSWRGKPVKQESYDRGKDKHKLAITDGLPVYNITSFTSGYTTATKIASREATNWYVKKYIDKNLGNSTDVFHKRFYCSGNLAMPKIVKEVLGENVDLVDMHKLLDVLSHDNVVFADQVKYGKYNTVQTWIDNHKKNLLKQGVRPVRDLETLFELDTVFAADKPTQINFTKEIMNYDNRRIIG